MEKQEIRHHLDEKFDVEYHPKYFLTLLDNLGIHYAISRTKRPDKSDDAEEILDERVEYVSDEASLEQPHNKQEDDDEDSVDHIGFE